MLDGVQLIGTGELTDRLWAHPSITVIGIDAPSVAAASNTLLASARAKVSLRVPPGNDVTKASDALAAHLKAHAPWGVHVAVNQNATGAPYTAQTGGVAYEAANWALGEAWGRPAADIGGGGSIPFVTGYADLIPEAEILITGVEDPDTRAHGANESLHLPMFERVCLAETLLLHRLGDKGLNG
jgi:cysteinylglycine-S-conjugate dipeptidase